MAVKFLFFVAKRIINFKSYFPPYSGFNRLRKIPPFFENFCLVLDSVDSVAHMQIHNKLTIQP